MAYHPWFREVLNLGSEYAIVGLIYLDWSSPGQAMDAKPRAKEVMMDWISR